MPREHGKSGEYVETVTLDDVLDTFDHVEGPVVLSADVADRLGCSRETARRKLEALHDRGDLRRRKVSRRVIYWRDDDAESGRERGVTPVGEQADPTPSPGETPPTPTPTRTDGEDPIGDALAGWTPATETSSATAHTQTRRAVEYLATTGARLTRSDFVDALADGSSLGGRTWWERAVQPGLRHLADADLVEYRPGHHDYRWIGPDVTADAGGEDEDGSGIYDPTEEFTE